MNQEEMQQIFKRTKRTSDKIIESIKEVYDSVSKKYVYFVNMTDGSRYLYHYELQAQHNYTLEPKYYHRIIKIKS